MFEVVDLRGGPEERGQAHGRALAPLIAKNVALYSGHLKELGWSSAEIAEGARIWLETARKADDAFVAEMNAIARGAGLEDIELAIVCGRYELMQSAMRGSVSKNADGCTAIAVRDRVSANGHFLLAQNWDWLAGSAGRIAVLRCRGESGAPDTLALTEAGIPRGKIGLNSAGLGLAFNGLMAREAHPWVPTAIPIHVRCAQIIASSRFDEAIGSAIAPGQTACAFFLIAQPGGEIIGLQTWPRGYRALYDKEGVLTGANHFESVAGIASALEFNDPHSLFRASRLRDLVVRHSSLITLADLKSALSDHFSYPASLCRHIDDAAPPYKRLVTNSCIIMDLDQATIHISKGPPCGGDFQEIQL